MMTIDQKIQKAKEKEFDLTRSEVRKIMSAATKRNKCLCEIDGWYTAGADEFGFQKVECHIYDPLNDLRLDDVVIHCCLFDRRHSFVQAVA